MADTSPPPRKIQVTQETLDKTLAAWQWYVSCPMWELETDNLEKQISQYAFKNRIEAIYDGEGNEMDEADEFTELTYDGQKIYLLDMDANKWEVVCEVL